MMLYKTGNVAHDTTVAAADAIRQSAQQSRPRRLLHILLTWHSTLQS